MLLSGTLDVADERRCSGTPEDTYTARRSRDYPRGYLKVDKIVTTSVKLDRGTLDVTDARGSSGKLLTTMTLQALLFIGIGRADCTLGVIRGANFFLYHIVHTTAHGWLIKFLCVSRIFGCLLQYYNRDRILATFWQHFGNISC